jgi:3-carboxy-cis,cis-muconate cycloisomerase
MAVCAFDHPILGGLLGDEEMASCFAVEQDLEAMLAFEAALAKAEAAEAVIPAAAAEAIATACARFVPDRRGLAEGTRRDGLLVPSLVKQLCAAVGEPHAQHVHRGATSQDVIDTSLVLRLRSALDLLDGRLAGVVAQLAQLGARHGRRTVMGRTRMQNALPIPFAHRITSWQAPLEAHRDRLASLRPRLLTLQFGGAVGTRESLGDKGNAIAARLAAELGLGSPDPVWHAMRDRLVEFADLLSLIAGSLGKLGQDVALMAQNDTGEVRLASGGRSSAMAHKSNPVAAEVLVALARFNATLVSAMHHALVHENERSGAAWTLEWLVLPQMAVAAAAAVRLGAELLDALVFPNGSS